MDAFPSGMKNLPPGAARRSLRRRLERTALCLLLVIPAVPAAASPEHLVVQGVLRTGTGQPVTGSHTLDVKLYTAQTGGAAVWSDTLEGVDVDGGLFDAELGPFDSQSGPFASLSELWLEVAVAGEPPLPRQPLLTAPYALQAVRAGTALDVECSGCIGGSHLANGSVNADKVSFGYAVSDAPGGAATTAKALTCTGCLNGGHLADGSIGASKVAFAFAAGDAPNGDALTALSLSCTGCVTGTQLAAGSVTTGAITDGAVTAAKASFPWAASSSAGGAATSAAGLSCTGCVSGSHLGSGVVTSAALGSNAVTTAKLDTGAVTTAKIGDGAVTAVQIADGTITGTKLVNGTIPPAKVGFNYAGSTSQGGPAQNADMAFDLSCTGCVANAHIASVGAAKVTAGTFGAGQFNFQNNVVVGGSLQVGPDSGQCTQGRAGTIRWSGSALQVCDGSQWVTLVEGTGGGPSSTCGDGIVDAGEACDDGNRIPCDACDATCTGSGTGKQFTGAHTIGPGSFTTFNAAISALLQCGVSGPTTFTVAAGKYTESQGFAFPVVSGASTQNTVTFKAAPGASVKLVGTTGTASYNGVIRLNNNAAHYVLDGFEIDGSEPDNKIATSYSGPISFQGGGGQTNITLRNLHIHDFGPSAWGSTSYIGGIYIQQSATVSDITIVGCTFENLDPGAAFHTQGAISTRNGTHTGFRIIGNTFRGIARMDCINLRNGAGWTDLVIANNFFVVGTLGAVEFYGTNTLLNAARFVFNTIVLNGGTVGVYGAVTGSALEVRNNVMMPASGSGTFVSGITPSPVGYNCLTSAITKGYSGTANDVIGDPKLMSLGPNWNLHLQSSSPCLNSGIAITGITTDIDGQTRSNPPDIGADEVP